MPGTIRHIIAELRGDAWFVEGRVLIEAHSEQADVDIASRIVELLAVDDAVVTLRQPDGTSISRRTRRRPGA